MGIGKQRLGTYCMAAALLAFGCGGAPTPAAEDLDQMSCDGVGCEDVAPESPSGAFTEYEASLPLPMDQTSETTRVCAAETVSAQLMPVNLFLMVDRSGSMAAQNKWQHATGALRSFLKNPESQGLRVALRFFSDDAPMAGCTMQGCNLDACSEPLVGIGTLAAAHGSADEQEERLVAAINGTFPRSGLGTPIYPALGGALKWASVYQSEHPSEKAVVVFVTDGEPNGCNQDLGDISALAADAFGAAGVATYAIGLEGSNEAQLDQIARAGATEHAIFIGASNDAEEQLARALDAIRGETMSCDLAVPRATDGRVVDTRQVNVTLNKDGAPVPLYQVDGPEDCSGQSAWYYDDPTAPRRIQLCPVACALAGQGSQSIEVQLGCMATRRESTGVR